MVFRGRSCGCSDEHLSKGVSASTEGNKVETISWVDRDVLTVPGNVRSRRMESNIENALVKLFPVSCDLLDTCLALKVPQPESCQCRKETKEMRTSTL